MGCRPRPAHSGDLGPRIRPSPLPRSAKRRVALVAGHSDNLFDVAYCLAGLQVSFGTTRYISRTGIIVNKLMTREAFRGTPMTDTLKLLCNVYWVIPDTESTRT